MPLNPTYPGVYIEEIPSGVRTITGVATSITAFVGRALRGPTDEDGPVVVNGFGDFERTFGGVWQESRLAFCVRDFFRNGGGQAVIVRLFQDTSTTTAAAKYALFDVAGLLVRAAFPGTWGAGLRIAVDVDVSPEAAKAMGITKSVTTGTGPTAVTTQEPDPAQLFNLTVRDVATGQMEVHRNLTLIASKSRRIDKVLKETSKLLRAQNGFPPAPPTLHANITAAHTAKDALRAAIGSSGEAAARTAYETALAALMDPISIEEAALQKMLRDSTTTLPQRKTQQEKVARLIQEKMAGVNDGTHLTEPSFFPTQGEVQKRGLYALDKVDLFNLVCIPPYKSPEAGWDTDAQVMDNVAAYCKLKRAFLILDPPPAWIDKDIARDKAPEFRGKNENSALFFPRLQQHDPFEEDRLGVFPLSGAVAGIFARTDAQRGVWKAPAGQEATLVGVPQLAVSLTDAENGELNPIGVNCLRTFAASGRVVWGARTRLGDDRLASEWKYIPVRRTALFIEESLYRGTQWVVFEPNDEPLWAQIRLNIGAFMQSLFRQGAFQGRSPREAYLVKCDRETTTQDDINRGIVNIIVGFAPLKPAEFVIIKLQQLAGQIET